MNPMYNGADLIFVLLVNVTYFYYVYAVWIFFQFLLEKNVFCDFSQENHTDQGPRFSVANFSKLHEPVCQISRLTLANFAHCN